MKPKKIRDVKKLTFEEKYVTPTHYNFRGTYVIFNKGLSFPFKYAGKIQSSRTMAGAIILKKSFEKLYHYDLEIVQVKKDFHAKWREEIPTRPFFEESLM